MDAKGDERCLFSPTPTTEKMLPGTPKRGIVTETISDQTVGLEEKDAGRDLFEKLAVHVREHYVNSKQIYSD